VTKVTFVGFRGGHGATVPPGSTPVQEEMWPLLVKRVCSIARKCGWEKALHKLKRYLSVAEVTELKLRTHWHIHQLWQNWFLFEALKLSCLYLFFHNFDWSCAQPTFCVKAFNREKGLDAFEKVVGNSSAQHAMQLNSLYFFATQQ